jgi:hypothetical protein
MRRKIAFTAEKGFVSLLILLVFVFLSWKSFQTFYKVESYERMVRLEAEKVKASYVAESGFGWALSMLKQDPLWAGGTRQMAGGIVEVVIQRDTQRYTIVAKAQMDNVVQKRCGEYRQENGELSLIAYRELYD